jgi:hypothetical protein
VLDRSDTEEKDMNDMNDQKQALKLIEDAVIPNQARCYRRCFIKNTQKCAQHRTFADDVERKARVFYQFPLGRLA